MTLLATILAVTSGFVLTRFHESPANLIATSLVLDAALAPVTAIVAARRERSIARWSLIGFVFGVWALAWVLLFKPARGAPGTDRFPPTSAAA
ncbi:MAG TPA: hypothetical protein VKS22_15240 [Candidatus Binataceae bacterium]|nr:hypothetical protein [Candidatus Binataceae bacterium]